MAFLLQHASQPHPQPHCLLAANQPPTPESVCKESNSNPDLAESLVFTASMIIESIWLTRTPSSSCTSHHQPAVAIAPPALAPLTRVIHELLRRSRTSCSTFQLSLLYLIKLRNGLLAKRAEDCPAAPATALRCGRRMFLAALILANKYLQDKNYSMKAWAKICGLEASELCANERVFLSCVNYDLFVQQSQWQRWSGTINKRVEMIRELRERKQRESRNRAMVCDWLQGVGAAIRPPVQLHHHQQQPVPHALSAAKSALLVQSAGAPPPSPPMSCPPHQPLAASQTRSTHQVAIAAPLTPPLDYAASATSGYRPSLKRVRSDGSSASSTSAPSSLLELKIPFGLWTGLPSPSADSSSYLGATVVPHEVFDVAASAPSTKRRKYP